MPKKDKHPIMARCGRTDPHGAHVFPREGGTKSGFCAGNRNIIEGK